MDQILPTSWSKKVRTENLSFPWIIWLLFFFVFFLSWHNTYIKSDSTIPLSCNFHYLEVNNNFYLMRNNLSSEQNNMNIARSGDWIGKKENREKTKVIHTSK